MVSKLTKTFTIFGYVIVSFFLGVITFYCVDTYQYRDRIGRNVFFAETEVSGMTNKEFELHLEQVQKTLGDKIIYLEYQGRRAEVQAIDIGLDLDSYDLWNTLYAIRKPSDLREKTLTWVHSFFEPITYEARQVVNETLLDKTAMNWEVIVPRREPDNGNVRIDGTRVVVRYPEPGIQIDIEKAQQLVIDALLYQEDGYVVQAPTTIIQTLRDKSSVDETVYWLGSFLLAPITMYHPSYPENKVEIKVDDLARLVYLSLPEGEEGPFEIRVHDQVLAELLKPLLPVEAKIVVTKDNHIAIEPSRDGFDINIQATAAEVLHFDTQSNDRKIPFVFDARVSPAFSTNKATSLRVEKEVSRFTTYHSCCQDRVDNIHRAADMIDGTRVDPGETFSLNDALGERTTARGFKKAGTIIDGQLEDSVGGGISQFTTTLHNAVYWGGYEILEHKPHSIYFSRYPIGIEATINWPEVDYVFRNDTQYGILIDTSYTDTSITIALYSYNYGRHVVGDHSHGVTNIEVSGAQPESRIVLSEVSSAYGFQLPRIMYINDPTVPRGTSVIAEEGDDQWNVNVIRKVFEGETAVRVDYWPVHYTNNPTIIKRNPCDAPGGSGASCFSENL